MTNYHGKLEKKLEMVRYRFIVKRRYSLKRKNINLPVLISIDIVVGKYSVVVACLLVVGHMLVAGVLVVGGMVVAGVLVVGGMVVAGVLVGGGIVVVGGEVGGAVKNKNIIINLEIT